MGAHNCRGWLLAAAGRAVAPFPVGVSASRSTSRDHPAGDSRPYEQGVALARLRPSQRRGGPPNPAAPFWEYLFAEVRELCEGASNKTRPLRRDQRLISERDANHTIYGGGLALIGECPESDAWAPPLTCPNDHRGPARM